MSLAELDGNGAALGFAWRARQRQSEGERARNGGSTNVASLFTPLRPDQQAQQVAAAAYAWSAMTADVDIG